MSGSSSRLWLFLTALLLCGRVIGQQCPTLTSIFPPSGVKNSQVFEISGMNLDAADLTSSSGAIRTSLQNATTILFTIIASDMVTITLIPQDATNCVNMSDTIDVKANMVSFDSPEPGTPCQPGTVLFIHGCFPYTCGDNSTLYTVTLGGVDAELLDSTEFGKQKSSTSDFYIRLGDISSAIPQAKIVLTSQYGIEYESDLTVDYQPNGNITSVSPSTGQLGTEVNITGTNLIGLGGNLNISLDSVTLGGIPAEIINSTQSWVLVKAASGSAGLGGGIVALNSSQTSHVTKQPINGPRIAISNLWTYLDDGLITQLIPPAGQEGTTVRVCGTSLLGGGTGLTSVTFINESSSTISNGLENLSDPAVPDECVSAILPAPGGPLPQEGPVKVIADTKAIITTDDGVVFKYANVLSVSPSSGQEYTIVTITGSHLLSGYNQSEVSEPQVVLGSTLATIISYSESEVVVQAAPPFSPQAIDSPGNVAISVKKFALKFDVALSNGWTYLEAGSVYGVQPSIGQVGTRVTINGTNLFGYGTRVDYVSILGTQTGSVDSDPHVNATLIDSNQTTIIIDMPTPNNDGYTGPVNILIVADNGAQITAIGLFMYKERGNITAVSPTTGQRGTYITISGTNLFGYGENLTEVTLGDDTKAEVIYKDSNDTSVRIRAAALTVTMTALVDITLLSDTNAIVKSTNQPFSYLVEGEIADVYPRKGQIGTKVNITGTQLLGGGASIHSIFLDGVEPSVVSSFSDTLITVTMGDLTDRDHNLHPGEVYIESDTGAQVIGGSFNHIAPGNITSITPTMGSRGTEITITGYNLTAHGNYIQSVSVGDYVVTRADTDLTTSNDDTKLVILAPNGPSGHSGPVTINADTSATLFSFQVFNFSQPGVITMVTPSSGSEGSGVLVEGTDLVVDGLSIASVSIGGSEAERVVTQSSNLVSFIAGPTPSNDSALSNLSIRIELSDGSFTEGGAFSYEEFSLFIVGTNEGQHGSNIALKPEFPVDEVSLVEFNNVQAEIVERNYQNQTVTVQAPRALLVGEHTVDVTVTNTDNNVARLKSGFIYLSEGFVCSVSPEEGQRGTRVKITGENLLGGGTEITSVTFGEVEGTIESYSNEEINATIGSNIEGMSTYPYSVDVMIMSDTGATATLVDGFSFIEPGEIISITPSSGQFGTLVTISGSGLMEEDKEIVLVKLAGVEANVIGTPNDTYILVSAGASNASLGLVSIITSTGAEILSNQSYEYLTQGSITSITPINGTEGTIVTINGQHMLGGGSSVASVELGGVAAEVDEGGSDAVIEVIVGAGGNVSAAPGDVVVTSNTGSTVTLTDTWSFTQPGNISSVSPLTGQQGTLVTIEGSNLLAGYHDNVTSVQLAGVPVVRIVEQSSTQIIVEADYSNTSQSGLVTVELESGPVITGLTNWSYYAIAIDSVTPSNGTNGTYVTITGTNIAGEPSGVANASAVTLAGIDCYDIEVLSSDSVCVRAGFIDNANSLIGDVQIVALSGAYVVFEQGWTYLPNGAIDSVEPAIGAPGENVTIIGSRLVPDGIAGLDVYLGQTKSFSVTIINSSMVVFRVGVYSFPDKPGTPVPMYIVADDGSTIVSDGNVFTLASTYIADSVAPIAGQGGREVVINGSFSQDIARVYLAGVEADIINETETSVRVRAGDGPEEGNDGAVSIALSNGTLIGLGGNAWTYLPILTAAHVTPLSGRNGTLVTINVEDVPTAFTLESVHLGDTLADIISSDGRVIKVRVNSSPAAADFNVTDITINYEDDIRLVIQDSWTYQPPVVIHSNSTLQGYYGSEVKLIGAGFRGGSAGNVSVVSVTLADGFSTELVSQSDELLVMEITETYDSRNASVEGPIIISWADGAVYDSAATSNITFTYVQVMVESVSPDNGQNGTRVTISGTGLLAGGDSIALLTLAGVDVDTIESNSDTSIVAVAAGFDNATGPGDIQYVMNTGATVTIDSSWSYLELGQVTLVTPAYGVKGILVNILGDRLLGGGAKADEVYLNGVPALEVTVSDDNVVQVRAGDGPPGVVGGIKIVADTGAILTSAPSETLFEYTQPGTIDSITPLSGQVGTMVTIMGEELFDNEEGIRKVTIAGIEADILSYNATVIEVSLQRPPVASSFTGQVAIESSNRALVESNDNFTYLREGDITSVVPSQGQYQTEVTIGGNRLLGGGSMITSVTLAGVLANIISQSNSEVKVQANKTVDSILQDVSGDIVLTSETGAQVSLIDSWTYVQVGVVSSVEPQSGQYGTKIKLVGERLTAGGMAVEKVIVGDTESLEVLSSSATEVIFRAGEPMSLNPFSDVITLISNDNGELESGLNWNYTAAAQITDIQPANGTGGMVIVISGVNLLGGGDIGLSVDSVSIVGINVNRIVNQSDSAIEVEVGFNPDGQEKSGNVTIETSSGSIIHLESGWTYLNECPIGQFGNNTNSCSLCNEECNHCHGPTEYDCYSCKNFLISNDSLNQCVPKCPSLSTLEKVCVESCQTNQFIVTRNDFNKYCIDCHPQCDPDLSCHGNYSSQCTACLNVELDGECVASCPIGYFVGNGSSCVPCSDECELGAGCWGPDAHQCNECLNVTIFKLQEQIDECIPSCPSGYFTDSNDYCQLCNSECLGGCTGPLSSDCHRCKHATFTDPLFGIEQCVTDCNHNSSYTIYYTNTTTGYCGRCHSYCSTAAGCFGPSATDCHQCLNFTGSNTDPSEFFPLLNGECVPDCGSNKYYIDRVSGNCTLCHENCTNGCTGSGPDKCIDISSTATPSETSTVTEGSSIDPLSAGIAVIGIAVGAFVLMFLVMLVIIVCLVVKLNRARSSGKGNIYPEDADEIPAAAHFPLHTTSFNRMDSNLSRVTIPHHGNSHINPVFDTNEYTIGNETVPNPQQPSVVVNNNPQINPSFNTDENVYELSDQPEDTTITRPTQDGNRENDSDDDVSQTASEAYMEMELSFQQQLALRASMRANQAPDILSRPTAYEGSQSSSLSSNGDMPTPPPRPPKSTSQPALGAKPSIPMRTQIQDPPEVTFVENSMELLTQDEYEDPQITLAGLPGISTTTPTPQQQAPVLPQRPSRDPIRSHISSTSTGIEMDGETDGQEEDVYEATDSNTTIIGTRSSIRYSDIRHDLPPQLMIPTTIQDPPPPEIPPPPRGLPPATERVPEIPPPPRGLPPATERVPEIPPPPRGLPPGTERAPEIPPPPRGLPPGTERAPEIPPPPRGLPPGTERVPEVPQRRSQVLQRQSSNPPPIPSRSSRTSFHQ